MPKSLAQTPSVGEFISRMLEVGGAMGVRMAINRVMGVNGVPDQRRYFARMKDGRKIVSQPLPWNDDELMSFDMLRAIFAQLDLDPKAFGYDLSWAPPDQEGDDDEPSLN